MELVSAPGEAYNSSSACGKVDLGMSSVVIVIVTVIVIVIVTVIVIVIVILVVIVIFIAILIVMTRRAYKLLAVLIKSSSEAEVS